MIFQTFLEQNVPPHFWKGANTLLPEGVDVSEHLRAAYNAGYQARAEVAEIAETKAQAHVEGLRLALQDKVQIHHNVVQKKRWWQK